LDAAVNKAYAAVSQPAEGTILTVAKGAALAARAVPGDDFAAVIRAAAAGAREALEKTTEQLPALKAAGVVDAGGRGLVVVLEALARVMGAAHEGAPDPAPIVPRDPRALVAARESGSAEFGYEVQFLLDAADGAIAPLKATLDGLGDSLVVVGGNALFNVHVHVNDVGAALEAAVTAGRPHRISVIHFADQIAGQERAAADAERRVRSAGRRRLVIAAVSGSGLCRLYEAAGAYVVPADVSAGELELAIADSAADELVLLPNSADLLGRSQQLPPMRLGCHLHVVPTLSPVQGLEALAVHHPEQAVADDVIAMTTAATAMRWGEISAAPEGIQGSVEGDVVAIGTDVCAVSLDVLRLILRGAHELLTLVVGESLAGHEVVALTTAVRAAYPEVQIETHRGEQPGTLLLMGVE
jgi:dihydroxyacetone kinase-like predicted kinase